MQLNEWDVIVFNQFTAETIEFGIWRREHKKSFLLHVFSILLVDLDEF